MLPIERRSFHGTDITATLRPWLHRRGFETFYRDFKDLFLPDDKLGEVGISFESNNSTRTFSDDIPLFCGIVKKQLMAALLKEGVHALLMTGVWGL